MDTVVMRKKSRMVLALVFLVVFAVAIYFPLEWLEQSMKGFLKFKVAIMVVLGATFVFAFVILIRNLIRNKPDIVIGEEGLTDNSGPFSVGFIPWSDIKSLEGRLNEVKLKFLVVHLHNPENYLRPQKNTRLTTNYHMKQFGSPVVIAGTGLSVGYEELIRLIKEKLDAYRAANPN